MKKFLFYKYESTLNEVSKKVIIFYNFLIYIKKFANGKTDATI